MQIIAAAKKRGAEKANSTKSMIVMDAKPWDDTIGMSGTWLALINAPDKGVHIQQTLQTELSVCCRHGSVRKRGQIHYQGGTSLGSM